MKDIALMFKQYGGSAFCTVSLKEHIDLTNSVGLTIEKIVWIRRSILYTGSHSMIDTIRKQGMTYRLYQP